MGTTERTERLLRLARERRDLAAVAILEGKGKPPYRWVRVAHNNWRFTDETEAELRAAWGDR